MIARFTNWLEARRLAGYRRRMRAMRVMYPPEGESSRSLNPKPRAVVRQFGPRPR